MPLQLTAKINREFHGLEGHLGAQRLWPEIEGQHLFSNPELAKRINALVGRACEECQVSNPPRGPYKCPLEHIPVPPRIMSHVAVDLFSIPEVTVNGQIYDIMALCVYRTSGWIVATPHQNKGLTAEKIAKVMFQH